MSYRHDPAIAERMRTRLPHALRRPVTLAFALAFADCLQEQESERASLAAYLSDPAACSGSWLDRWGEIVDEPRGGLNNDREYLAIIRGKVAAVNAGGLPTGIAETWRVLAFEPPLGSWSMEPGPDPSVPYVALSARVSVLPSEHYAERAGAVLALALGTGIDGYGSLYVGGSGYAFDLAEPDAADLDSAVPSMTIHGRSSP